MPGMPEAVDLRPLQRRDLAPEPDEPPLRCQPLAQLGGVGIGHDRGEQFGCLVDVDDAVRLGEQRGHAHVGRQHLAVAIEDVGSSGGDRVLRRRRGARRAPRARPRTCTSRAAITA